MGPHSPSGPVEPILERASAAAWPPLVLMTFHRLGKIVECYPLASACRVHLLVSRGLALPASLLARVAGAGAISGPSPCTRRRQHPPYAAPSPRCSIPHCAVLLAVLSVLPCQAPRRPCPPPPSPCCAPPTTAHPRPPRSPLSSRCSPHGGASPASNCFRTRRRWPTTTDWLLPWPGPTCSERKRRLEYAWVKKRSIQNRKSLI